MMFDVTKGIELIRLHSRSQKGVVVLVLTVEKLLTHWCITRNQWVLQLCFHTDDHFSEIEKAAPFLNKEQAALLAMEEVLFLPFNIERAAEYAYNMVIGDDGPTELNKYDGPCRIYAVLWNPQGECVNENT